ncbi:transporter [Ancylomarina sp. 16SWW S1-10-2]|uniref:transporter n=1 Tax=Ancylomarina sp. 16SWW S1-10-2 TaxID=2499681 RepID=UPI00189CE810|nr:transporter [Ancylomarina sp. 16SWW S1-10-2]
MKKIYTLVLIILALNLGIKAQTIVTDRPDQTESSVTVPLKSLQIESGILVGNEGNGDIKQLLIPSTLLRYGLSKNIELRFVQQFENLKNELTSEDNFGISDLEIGAKIQLFQKEDVNTEIAFLTHVILPTGSNNLSGDKFGTINKLAISHVINDNLGLGYNVGYDNMGEGEGDLTYSTALGIGLGGKFGTYVELYGEYAEFSSWGTNFDSGLTYLVKDNLQLDASFGLGLNHDMYYFSLGFSWNISNI